MPGKMAALLCTSRFAKSTRPSCSSLTGKALEKRCERPKCRDYSPFRSSTENVRFGEKQTVTLLVKRSEYFKGNYFEFFSLLNRHRQHPDRQLQYRFSNVF